MVEGFRQQSQAKNRLFPLKVRGPHPAWRGMSSTTASARDSAEDCPKTRCEVSFLCLQIPLSFLLPELRCSRLRGRQTTRVISLGILDGHHGNDNMQQLLLSLLAAVPAFADEQSVGDYGGSDYGDAS